MCLGSGIFRSVAKKVNETAELRGGANEDGDVGGWRTRAGSVNRIRVSSG